MRHRGLRCRPFFKILELHRGTGACLERHRCDAETSLAARHLHADYLDQAIRRISGVPLPMGV